MNMLEVYLNMSRSVQLYWCGVFQYMNGFMSPSWNAVEYLAQREKEKLRDSSPVEAAAGFLQLLQFSAELAMKGRLGSVAVMSDYHLRQMKQAIDAMVNTLSHSGGEDIASFSKRQNDLMDLIINAYPKAIREIGPEFGLHLDGGGYVKVAETDRFELYQVLPHGGKVQVREHAKPVLVLPPYVLGPNILAFLPGEGKSYLHCFANNGVPTYIRIVKDISANPAVQLMTGEEDALDTRLFCERIMARHGKQVTLNGFCQGGFIAVLDLLSGELDGLVDALITCVAPLDGSRSRSLVDYMNLLPPRFRDIGYAVKTLPNGNRVVDGKIMGWVFKLKSIEKESPLFSLYRDLGMFDSGAGREPKITKTAAALNHWVLYDQRDLPLAITRLSYDSYARPVDREGNLPTPLFGRRLNFKRIQEKGIKWLICTTEKDDLVDGGAAVAPLDFVNAEVTVFPKGHVSIATSWSLPTSEFALNSCFIVKSPNFTGKSRGPVRFHLDLDETGSAEQTCGIQER